MINPLTNPRGGLQKGNQRSGVRAADGHCRAVPSRLGQERARVAGSGAGLPAAPALAGPLRRLTEELAGGCCRGGRTAGRAVCPTPPPRGAGTCCAAGAAPGVTNGSKARPAAAPHLSPRRSASPPGGEPKRLRVLRLIASCCFTKAARPAQPRTRRTATADATEVCSGFAKYCMEKQRRGCN